VSEALLLMTVGMCDYLGMMRLWFGFQTAGPGSWAGSWAISAALFATLRLFETHAQSAESAVWLARLAAGAAVPVMWTILCFVESLCSGAARIRRLSWAILPLSLLPVLSPWVITGDTVALEGADGAALFRAVRGDIVPLYGLGIVATLGWCGRELVRARELPAHDKRVLAALLVGYGGMAALSLANEIALTSYAGFVEFALLAMAIGLGHLVMRHQFRLESELVAQAERRSRDLADSEARYRDVVENMPIGLLSVNARGELEHANAKLLSMLGSTFTEFASAFDVLHEENAERSGFSPMLARSLQTGESFSSEFEFDSWWGRRLITRASVTPRRSAQGAITGALAVIEDVTEQRAIERRLQDAQRIEAVGQLAAGIAHEINNPMAYVRANLSMLAEEVDALSKSVAANAPGAPALPQVAELRQLLQSSLASVGRTVAVVRDLREFSHSSSAQREATDVNALLDNAARLAVTRSESSCEVRLELGEVPSIVGAPGQLAQVMLTLLVQAMHRASGASIVRASTTADGDEVLVVVQDDRAPIPPAERARLFEPFAKVRGEEPSLALYVARQIVQEHGGRIEVRSNQQQGTTFSVHLPARKDPLE